MTYQRAHAAIAEERRRQRVTLGYSEDHDRHHGTVMLFKAGRAYLNADQTMWPWDGASFKPRTRIRNLVKAGALFMAAVDISVPDSGTWFQATRLVEDTTQVLAAELTAAQMLVPGIPPAPEPYVVRPHRPPYSGGCCDEHPARQPEFTPRTLNEGDNVKLAAKIYRCDSEQALIEFTSMEGTYSIRVPLSELS